MFCILIIQNQILIYELLNHTNGDSHGEKPLIMSNSHKYQQKDDAI